MEHALLAWTYLTAQLVENWSRQPGLLSFCDKNCDEHCDDVATVTNISRVIFNNHEHCIKPSPIDFRL